MKLEDWVMDNVRADDRYGDKELYDPAMSLKDKHVISTCEFCGHYIMFGSACQIDKCGLLRIESTKDFGCIHWSEKK